MSELIPTGRWVDHGAGWGDWRLGDLSDSLQSVARVLGPSAHVGWVSVYAPSEADRLPVVQLAVEEREQLEGLRDMLSETGDLLLPLDGDWERNFQAIADGVMLHVWIRG